MRVLWLFAVTCLLSGTAVASAPIEILPDKPAKKKPAKLIRLKEQDVQGSTMKAAVIVIPRDPGATKAVDTTNDHLLDALQRN